MPYDFNFGSSTAKSGFFTEKEVVQKFNNWQKDKDAQEWLKIMGYKLDEIKILKATHIPARLSKNSLEKLGLGNIENYDELLAFKKADLQVRLYVNVNGIWKVENISVKKTSKNANFNQVDKRRVADYKKYWKFSEEIEIALKLFTGEIPPFEYSEFLNKKPDKLRDKKKRRIFLDELKPEILNKVIQFFSKNKVLVIADVLKGRGALSANWMLVIHYSDNKTLWTLKDINTVMNIYSQGEVKLSSKGSLWIGKVFMQRKGGTPDPTKLQFKINPLLLFK
jgi:hypothetical protein